MDYLSRQYQKRNKFRKQPIIAQALWLIPIFGLLKNLYDTVIIGRDSISDRKFWIKEKFFKTLSGVFALSFWFIILFYSTIDNFNTYFLLVLTTLLQAGNWASYLIGVYFSGELQKLIIRHKLNLQRHSRKALQSTKSWVQKVGNTIKNIRKKK